ncbi:MAG: SOS response-associated peptidase [Anaerolineae bacterium]|nr:SOS response-associated peptidase [Chloroflexota bacterium]MBP6298680.1 SOS response-associated peptidase [Anaerolineae bacterium]
MCGRFVLTADAATLLEAFGLEGAMVQMAPRYNIAPTQPVAVITNAEPRKLTFHRWGLVPSWAKDISIGSKMFNARAETVAEKPSFKNALKRRRCLVPANGFYEWPEKGKNPMYIHLDGDPVFAFAGLWETWRSPDGDELNSCTILTGEPNDYIRQFHNRMAIILPKESYSEWLFSGEMRAEEALSFLQPYPAERMHAYEVSKLVNGANTEGADLIAPVGGQGTLL